MQIILRAHGETGGHRTEKKDWEIEVLGDAFKPIKTNAVIIRQVDAVEAYV